MGVAQAPPDTKQSLVGVSWTILRRLIGNGRGTAVGVTVLLVLGCSFGARAQAQQANPLNQQTDVKGTGQSVANRVARSERLNALPDSPEPKAGEQPSLFTPLKRQEQDGNYVPIGARQRLEWAISATFAPQGLLAGVITSGVGTARNKPHEDGPGWSGFGQRYGTRLGGIITSNVMEAGVGAMWGEDPRYFGVRDKPFGQRVKNVMWQTVVARRADGQFEPAYARYIAISGSNFLSNTWRPNSEANTSSALIRTGEGFAGRMCSNAFEEFWPDVSHYLFHRHDTKQ